MNLTKWISYILIAGLVGFIIGRYFYMKPKFINGEKAPNFRIVQTPSGEVKELTDLEGQYVLIDFWGSWCAPCRKENPELVNLYNKYASKKFQDADGFQIVSVGVERDKARWRRAIKRDELNWKYHIIDETENLKFFNGEITGLYGVKQIPTKYLLNPRGQIIGVNQSVEAIDKMLENKLIN